MYTREELKKVTKVTPLRGSGPGGQNRNKVETGVRLKHRPTGIIVVASKERSQARNRKIAFERLAQKIEKAQRPKVPRFSTRVSQSQKSKRLEEKKRRSQTIESRRSLDEE